jgi:hypothetical protein
VVTSAALVLPSRPVARVPPRARARACASPGAPAQVSPAQVSPDELSNEMLRDIVLQRIPDQEVNELAWRCLGYTRDPAVEGGWSNAGVFPNWRKNYPRPPDLIGVTRTYSREVDEPVLRAVQALQRSVPREHKDQLKPTLKPIGWQGFKMEGLTPNMTRRAQVSTWLLYFRQVPITPSPRVQPCSRIRAVHWSSCACRFPVFLRARRDAPPIATRKWTAPLLCVLSCSGAPMPSHARFVPPCPTLPCPPAQAPQRCLLPPLFRSCWVSLWRS